MTEEGSNNSTPKTATSDSDSTSAEFMVQPMRLKGASARDDSLHVCCPFHVLLYISLEEIRKRLI